MFKFKRLLIALSLSSIIVIPASANIFCPQTIICDRDRDTNSCHPNTPAPELPRMEESGTVKQGTYNLAAICAGFESSRPANCNYVLAMEGVRKTIMLSTPTDNPHNIQVSYTPSTAWIISGYAATCNDLTPGSCPLGIPNKK